MSGFCLLLVNRLASGLKQRQMSMRSNRLEMYLISFNELVWVTGVLPFLSFWTSSTRLKSPPRTISLQSKQRSWLRTFWKNIGLSSFGAYILTKVKIFSSDLISTMTNLPSGSEKDFTIWKLKFLLNGESFNLFLALKTMSLSYLLRKRAIIGLGKVLEASSECGFPTRWTAWKWISSTLMFKPFCIMCYTTSIQPLSLRSGTFINLRFSHRE